MALRYKAIVGPGNERELCQVPAPFGGAAEGGCAGGAGAPPPPLTLSILETTFQGSSRTRKRGAAGRSAAALRFTIDRMAEGGRILRMWTFTLPVLLDVPVACRSWSALLKRLRSELGFLGVRVFELHEEHGLHVHCVTNEYYRVNDVRAICSAMGWGRVHVCRVTKAPYYVAKYVSKAARLGAFEGRRLWASFGKLDGCKVRDVQRDSLSVRCFRQAWASEEACEMRCRGRNREAYRYAGHQAAIIEWDAITGDHRWSYEAWLGALEAARLMEAAGLFKRA